MARNNKGFTLIELMVVVAIVGLILGIAIPSYSNQVVRARRTEAAKELIAYAAAEERFNTNCNSYTSSLTGAQASCTGLGAASTTSENGYYTISVAATPTTFTLTATPTATGGQSRDTKCLSLSITNTGTKTVSGSGNAAKCWAGGSG